MAIGQRMNLLINELTNQAHVPIVRLSEQPIGQRSDRPTNQLANERTNLPINVLMNELLN